MRRRRRDGLRVRHEQRRMGELDRLGVVRRDDHPHADPRLVEQLLGKAIGHPHAAVRGRISGQRPAVQRDAVPGDALHVRHPGIVIEARVVVLVLLDDGEDAGRRLASLGAGRHRRAQDPAVGVVDRHLLALDRHDRHDRLAGFARGRRLGRVRGTRLRRRGVGGRRAVSAVSAAGRERHDGAGPPPPDRPGLSGEARPVRRPASACFASYGRVRVGRSAERVGGSSKREGGSAQADGLRRRESMCHAMPRLKCRPRASAGRKSRRNNAWERLDVCRLTARGQQTINNKPVTCARAAGQVHRM